MPRIIMDTNVILRGILHAESASGRVLAICDTRTVVPVLSRPVFREYREVLTDQALVRKYPEQLRIETVESILSRLLYVADLMREVRSRFIFPRDPKDAKFIELAIAGRASDLVTCDQDLLTLASGVDEVSRRFRRRLPALRVLRPEAFLNR